MGVESFVDCLLSFNVHEINGHDLLFIYNIRNVSLISFSWTRSDRSLSIIASSHTVSFWICLFPLFFLFFNSLISSVVLFYIFFCWIWA